MKNRIFYLFSLIVFTSLFSQENDPYRLTHVVEPEYQFLHFDLDPNKKEYSANTTIHLNVTEEISEFRLHGTDFEISEIILLSDDESTKVEYEFLEHGFLKISTSSVIAPGKYKLKFHIHGTINEKGEGIISFEKDSLNYIYTQMQSRYARQFFPSFDEPGFKFPYQIEITTPKDFLVVSNTSIEKESLVGINKNVLFKPTKPIPSSLLAFAVGPYESTAIPGLLMPGRLILPRGYLDNSYYIKSNTARILKALENYLGYPYPYEKLDFIGVSNFNAGAMENPGLIVFHERYLIDSEELSRDEKLNRAYATAHEIAHMWFGNLVTHYWWDDLWLNEGFATWLGYEIVVQEFPDLNARELLANSINGPLAVDTKATAEPIHRSFSGLDNPEEAFDALSYEKSGILLRLIESWIGKKQFQHGLKIYFSEYQWKNANAQDLLEILQEVSGKDVVTVLEDFVFQAGIPTVSVTIENKNSILLEQQRYKAIENENNYDTMWHMPIACKIFDGQKIHEKYIYMSQQNQSFNFPGIESIQWIHLRNNLLGYLIQVVPPNMLTQIIQTDVLDMYEKQDFLTGVKYEYFAGSSPPQDILDLGYEMRHSKDEAIMNAIVERINDIETTYYHDNTNNDFLFYCNHSLRPMLENVGFDIVEGEPGKTGNSRTQLLWLLRHDQQVIEQIASLGEKYLYGDKKLTWDHFTYLELLFYYKGNASMYDHAIKRFKSTKNPTEREMMNRSLGFFQDSSLVNKTKLFILNGDLEPNERILSADAIQWMYDDLECKGNSILPWISEHFDFFEQTISSDVLDAFLPYFIWNKNNLELFYQLFPEEKMSKTLKNNLAKQVEYLKRTEKLRNLYSTELDEYMAEFRTRIE